MAAPDPDPEATQRIPADGDLTVLAAGRRVFARYTLVALAGRGGMGVVWRARDNELECDVALKFLPESVAADKEAVRDLKRETRRCRELTHPHIVRVHDFVQEGPQAAIAMEFIEGESLASRKAEAPGGCLSASELTPIVAQLCAALDYAHTIARIAHRDLKPANLLVTAAGALKVADFGIARSLAETQTRLTGSAAGGTSGTLPFMSPQQLAGDKPAEGDDIYALGATLYDLLTGKPPFYRGDAYSLMKQIGERLPAPLEAHRTELENTGAPIPPAWEATILACLAKRAEDRPRSAREVAARLGLSGVGPPLAGMPPREDQTEVIAPGESRRVLPARRRATWIGLGVAAVALAVLAVGFWPKSAAPQKTAAVVKPSDGAPASGGPTTKQLVPAPLAREFNVTVDPADAGAHLWLGPQSDVAVPTSGHAVVKDLPDGEHELIVQAAGFQPFTTRVLVKDGRGSAEAKLIAVRGAVEIAARPGTVVTAVDARGRETRLGSVPAGGTLKSDNLLTIGSYTFKLTHEDCAPVEVKAVELALGRPAKVAPAQTALPGELRVFSVPTGAEVSVDGKKVGVTPATLLAQPGEAPLALEVYLRGYRRSTQTVTLKPKEVRTVNVGTLAPESGGIDLRFSISDFRFEQASMLVDGRQVERIDPNAHSFDGLEVGARAVEITHPDYEPWKQSVTVRDQDTTAVEVKLAPKPGRLTVRAEPREIMLSINGRAVRGDEIRNGELLLPAGESLALVASAKGYKSATYNLTLPANGADRWEVALEKLRGAEPGQPWTIPDLNLTLVPVAAGSFAMGSESGGNNEKPVTRVTITKAFWLGKTEVTQREWTAIMGSNPSNFKGENLPVENVSWEDAMGFCQKLTARERAAERLPEGYAYTLPTEAQWEYACRAGTSGDYAGALDGMAWYDKNSGNTTHAVGTKQANAWGLYDMHGNVWEWCADWYADKLPGGTVRDPVGAAQGSIRVFRGGGWYSVAAYCRSAFRYNIEPGFRFFFLGFRLALAPQVSR